MSARKESKILILRDIRDKKEILMGAFSEKLTKADKNKAWGEVHEKAVALGIVPSNKNFMYTRNTFWQNVRKNTMKKLDARKKTGEKGGKECKLNEIDNLVCDIIGRDSPVIEGLLTRESWDEPFQLHDNDNANTENIIPIDEISEIQSEIESEICNARPTPKCNKRKEKYEKENEKEQLTLKKMKLCIEIMEREKYIKDLEILKLERELKVLDPSPYTAHLQKNNIYIVNEKGALIFDKPN
ncbi:hypothetical protein ABEB36_000164 [Hypothenemus hampei]|uniref:Regulatory protein zeste n=1 Tax=Hypothenemus hampei TaxID=57062 RepID=A0ABD1FB60_HYPHA